MADLEAAIKTLGITSADDIQEVSKEVVSLAFVRTFVALQHKLTDDEKAQVQGFLKNENAEGYKVIMTLDGGKEAFEKSLDDIIRELQEDDAS